MIKYKSEITNLHFFIDYARSCAADAGFSGTDLLHIELAVEESVVNIISYAFQADKGIIQLKCEISNDSFAVMISDNGQPFNLLEQADPEIDVPIEKRAAGGLGIFLIKKMMDKVKYERIDNYNIITLKKYIGNQKT